MKEYVTAASEVDKFIREIREMDEEVGEFRAFFLAYIEALFFAPSDDEITTENDLSLEAISSSITEVWAAWVIARNIIENEEAYNGNYNPVEHAGHDLWLTRNGLGSGFWDGGWNEPYANKLNDLAKIMGEVTTYLGDDKLIYIM